MLSKSVLPLLVTLLVWAARGECEVIPDYNLSTAERSEPSTGPDYILTINQPNNEENRDTEASGRHVLDGLDCFIPYHVSLPADLPFFHQSKTTCGMQDNYPAEDMCSGEGYGGGEDFVYELEIAEAMFLRFTLDPKGTEWTYFEVRTVCFPPAGNCIVNYKNTAGTPFSSSVRKYEAGTYYILIDTWPGPTCIPEFDFTIDRIFVDQLVCPDGAVTENEPLMHQVNDGCAMQDGHNWEPLDCNSTVCGTAWSNGLIRDTDWYVFTLEENSQVTWSGEAEFGLGLFLLRADCTCRTIYVLDVAVSDLPNTPIECQAVLAAGTYWAWAGPSTFTPIVSGNEDYQVTLTCEPLSEYCQASGGCNEFIGSVAISGLVEFATGCDSYIDLTYPKIPMSPGQIYPIVITNGNSNKDDACGGWVDWNRNFVFETDEKITLYTNSGQGPYTGSIFVPSGLTEGWYRMRIRLQRSSTPNPCGTTTYGEVEDYSIMVGSAESIMVEFDPQEMRWDETTPADPPETVAVYVGTTEPYFTAGNTDLNSLRLNEFDPLTISMTGDNRIKTTFEKSSFIASFGTIWNGDPYPVFITGSEAVGGYFGISRSISFVGLKPGDVDLNEAVELVDVIYLMNYKFFGGPAPLPILDVADTNADGIINIKDIIYLIKYLFKSGPEPLHP